MTEKKMKSESNVDKLACLDLSEAYKTVLFRNNVGVFKSQNGRPVRVGLCNETREMNKMHKSGDRIGWTPVTVTPEMVGKTVAVFTSVEMKEEGYKPSGKAQIEHYEAQRRWADKVDQANGIAGIVDSPEKAVQLVTDWLYRMNS